MWRLLAVLVLTAVFAPCAAAQGVALDDRLPASHWTMDALAYLAPRLDPEGLPARAFEANRFGFFLPGFEPDRRLSRDEAAGIVLRMSQAADAQALTRTERAWLAVLQSEFAAEIARKARITGQTFTAVAAALPTPAYSGYLGGRLRDERDEGSSADAVYRATAAYLSPNAQAYLSLTNERRRGTGDGPRDNRFQVWDRLFVNWRSGEYRFAIGRDYLRYGPGYSGSLAFSDTAPAFDQIRLQRDFSLGKFLGKVNIQEFAATWRDNVYTDTGKVSGRVYLLGRRYQRELTKSWQFGVCEAAKTSRAPNPLIAALPFYLYQWMFISEDEEFNALYSLDLKKTFGERGEGYLDLVVDDWRAPDFLGGRSSTTRKAGLLLGGAVFSRRRPLPDSLRAELFTIDPETYAASRSAFPLVEYTRDSLPIGYPLGGNAKGVFLRADKWLSGRLELIAEFIHADQRRAEPPEGSGSWQSLAIGLSYDWSPRTSASLRYGSGWWPGADGSTVAKRRALELSFARTL